MKEFVQLRTEVQQSSRAPESSEVFEASKFPMNTEEELQAFSDSLKENASRHVSKNCRIHKFRMHGTLVLYWSLYGNARNDL